MTTDAEGNEIIEEPSGLRKQVEEHDQKRKDAERVAAEADERAKAAERELAFIKAGIQPDDPKQAYFVKGYEGDLTPEAIKAAAVAGGFAEAGETVPAGELQAHEAAANLSSGAGSTAGVDKVAEGLAAINSATSQEDVLAAAAAAGVRIKSDLAD